MECKLKIVLSDVHYIYAGYPHDDEKFQVSVWDGENRIPIGDVARTMHAAGDSYADRRTAISGKYGCDFAKKLEDAISVFNEEWWEEIDDDMEVYGRISACCRDDTEDKLRQLEELGIEVEDIRSEESKRLSRDCYELFHTDEESLCEELMAQESGGKLTKDECIAFLCEKFNVCKDAADWYLDEWCIYKFKEES